MRPAITCGDCPLWARALRLPVLPPRSPSVGDRTGQHRSVADLTRQDADIKRHLALGWSGPAASRTSQARSRAGPALPATVAVTCGFTCWYQSAAMVISVIGERRHAHLP
jgi:hypothetical protein